MSALMRRWATVSPPALLLALVVQLTDPGTGVAQPAAAPSAAPGESTESRYAVEVLVLHATNSGKGIDKRIGKMPELQQPPFSSYDSYELLDKKRLPLVKDQPRTLKLPNERVLRTQLLDVLPNDSIKLSASINQPRGKSFLPLLEVKAKAGQAFIVAGQKHKGGILVLVIRVLDGGPGKKDG